MAVNSTASRLRRGVAIVVLAAPMVAAASLPARSEVITAGEILDQFNAVVTGDFSTNSEVEGRLVAGTINNSGSVNTINSNSGSFNFNGGGSAGTDNPTFAMDDFTKPLNALESQLGGLTSNST